MRTFLVCFALVVIAASSGCASQSGSAGYRDARQSDPRGALRQDDDYIASVERAAARRGVTVEWVHPPFVRERSDSAAPARPTDDG